MPNIWRGNGRENGRDFADEYIDLSDFRRYLILTQDNYNGVKPVDRNTRHTLSFFKTEIPLPINLYLPFRIFIAIVLIAAGLFKIHDPAPLLVTIELLSIINNSIAIVIATILPVIEIAIGILLLTGIKTKIAVFSAAGLFWFFLAFSIYGNAAGFDADCGCFGNVIASDFGYGMIIRNLIFAVISTWLILLHKGKKF